MAWGLDPGQRDHPSPKHRAHKARKPILYRFDTVTELTTHHGRDVGKRRPAVTGLPHDRSDVVEIDVIVGSTHDPGQPSSKPARAQSRPQQHTVPLLLMPFEQPTRSYVVKVH